jgi:hypothetical protein
VSARDLWSAAGRVFPCVLAASTVFHNRPPLGAQPQRVALRLSWVSDSSWDGEYYQKPYRFHVHEELDGRLVFDVADSSLLPRGDSGLAVSQAHAVHAIQLRDGGVTSGAALLAASGSSAYSVDVRKEAGDCTAPTGETEPIALGAPFVGREEARTAWDTVAPGRALIVFRGAVPVGLAFAARPLSSQSVQRLLCPQPEVTTRRQVYGITVKAGDLLDRRQPQYSASGEGHWTSNTTRSEHGSTTTLRYNYDVRQRNPGRDDPSSSIGRLLVTKVLGMSWEIVR